MFPHYHHSSSLSLVAIEYLQWLLTIQSDRRCFHEAISVLCWLLILAEELVHGLGFTVIHGQIIQRFPAFPINGFSNLVGSRDEATLEGLRSPVQAISVRSSVLFKHAISTKTHV